MSIVTKCPTCGGNLTKIEPFIEWLEPVLYKCNGCYGEYKCYGEYLKVNGELKRLVASSSDELPAEQRDKELCLQQVKTGSYLVNRTYHHDGRITEKIISEENINKCDHPIVGYYDDFYKSIIKIEDDGSYPICGDEEEKLFQYCPLCGEKLEVCDDKDA